MNISIEIKSQQKTKKYNLTIQEQEMSEDSCEDDKPCEEPQKYNICKLFSRKYSKFIPNNTECSQKPKKDITYDENYCDICEKVVKNLHGRTHHKSKKHLANLRNRLEIGSLLSD
jgi:hypothetical protein